MGKLHSRPFQLGFYRTRVTIQTGTQVRAKGAKTSTTWVNTAERWAHLKPLTSDEQFEGERVLGRNQYLVTMPYLDSLTKSNRLTFVQKGTTKTLNIKGITNPDGMSREHVCECVEEL